LASKSNEPRVSGPIAGGDRGWPFGASMLDLEALGYQEAEYFLEGDADRFRPVDGADFGRDGVWSAEPDGGAAYKTRVLIYRPRDPERFNGTVVVTWNNVTAGYDLFGSDSLELFEGGFALVCVTVQKVGIDGLPQLNQGLAAWDPRRYGDLCIAGDDYSFDIFTQAALAIGPSRSTHPLDPMQGLDVKWVVAQGASQSAGRLATYINAIAPLNRVFDGFILTIYFGSGSALEVGDSVVNINDPQEAADTRNRLVGDNLLRDDLGTPIFVVNSELEAISCLGVRQPDTDTYRYWESAGTCHISRQSRVQRHAMTERDQLVTAPAAQGINAIPMKPLIDAAYYHMHRWLADDVIPPKQARLEFGPDGEVLRDRHGIAKGGIRLPQVDVPLAKNSAIPLADDIFAVLGGSSQPFDRDQILALYMDRDTFIAAFKRATTAALDAGVIRPREVANLIAEANNFWAAYTALD
jgi:hypothetical protein